MVRACTRLLDMTTNTQTTKSTAEQLKRRFTRETECAIRAMLALQR